MRQTQERTSSRPIANLDFLRIFLPPEIRLAQRQFMIQSSRSVNGEPSSCLGLYFVRLQSMQGDRFPASAEGGAQIGDHVQDLMHEVVRDSDIPVRISDQEHLAVLRDLGRISFADLDRTSHTFSSDRPSWIRNWREVKNFRKFRIPCVLSGQI